MKLCLLSILALVAGIAPASAITVVTPANGAQVTSPFNLTASTDTCDSKDAVAMGYSIDDGPTTIVPTSFSAKVVASQGPHILHVKCWGHRVHDHLPLNITVVSSTVPPPPPAATPAFSLAPGAYTSAQSVTLSDATAGAIIYYTTNGSTPTASSNTYSSAISVTAAETIKAIAVASGYSNSAVASASYTFTLSAATPTFSLAAGTYTSAQSVTLSAATPGATIYYTTNGTGPTTSSTQFTGTISVGTSEVIEAVAVAPGYTNSGLARADYIISSEKSGPTVPPNAISVTEIQQLPHWKFNHDPGTPGNSVGTMTLVSDPSLSGGAARFSNDFTDGGGEIYARSYANDPDATNFVYDNEVWIEEGSVVANLEMDNNQVMANGDTVIYAFQCAGDGGTWDYAGNLGTAAAPHVHWQHSTAPCNPADWATNMWHHVQISYVTYNSVWLDGVEAPINETIFSAFSLGWERGDLMTNFQVDGAPRASGSSVLYADNFTISRW
jgi:hypothetical protein